MLISKYPVLRDAIGIGYVSIINAFHVCSSCQSDAPFLYLHVQFKVVVVGIYRHLQDEMDPHYKCE